MKNFDSFMPDGASLEEALPRTTHLGIGAHADDLEILAFHGILECFDQLTPGFTGVVVTDGRSSPRSGRFQSTTDEEMVHIRKREQMQAAKIGKYSAQIFLGYKSQEIKELNPQLVENLRDIIEDSKPHTVYVHNLADKHDTHVAVALHTVEALRKTSHRPQKLYGCEVWRDLDWLPESRKVVLPVSGHEELALELCQVFHSQIAGGKRYDLGTVGRRRAHATFSEFQATDKESALVYAMDLMPLIENPKLSPHDFVKSLVEDLASDVADRIARLSQRTSP